MSSTTSRKKAVGREYVVFYGVPWETYGGIIDALGECHLRHTYDEGALEVPRIVSGVAWESYLKFLDAVAEYSLRHTYDEGTLEMMSPRKDHDWHHRLIGRLIEAMAFALDIPIQSVGSTTLRAAVGEKGLHPDEGYYVANEPLVRGKDEYDPEKDPPPDLVVDVDVTNTSLPRLPAFARIGVPEVWRVEGRRLHFYRLGRGGKYREVERSVAFPFIRPADVTRFLNRRHDTDEHSVVRAFVEWAERARATSRKTPDPRRRSSNRARKNQ